MFPGVNLQGKVLYFQTLYPPLENVTNLQNEIEAEASDEHMIRVKWNTIQCAHQYKVYQKVADWEMIGITRKNYFQRRGVPCLEYKFKVKAVVGDQETGFIETDEPIIIKSDLPSDHAVLNLDISETYDGANLSWDHNICAK